MRALLAELAIDALGIAGAGAITFGTWQMHHPAGWIIGGAFGIAAAFVLSRE